MFTCQSILEVFLYDMIYMACVLYSVYSNTTNPSYFVSADTFQSALDKHLEMQEAERQRLAKHRQKARHNPTKYTSVIVDGMDQSKTILPHFRRVPKDSKIKEGNFVKVHVVGAKVIGNECKAYAFLMFDNFKSDSNCMLTVLHKVILKMARPLPRVLFLTLDNTTKENKNKYVLAYLSFLVKQRVFEKVRLNFLLVGHTHEDIDQMFSCFSRNLRKKEAHDIIMLKEVIKDSYNIWGGVVIEDVEETIDWKLFVDNHLLNVNDITYNQHFRVREENGSVRIWSKQYCHSKWYPDDGIDIFKSQPTGLIQCAPKHALRSIEERARCLSEGSDVDARASLAGIKANLVALVKYIQPSSVDWWREFLEKQVSIDFNNTVLNEEFVWPDPGEHGNGDEENTAGPSTGADLEEFFPDERPMYTGTRRTRQYRQERQGNLNDMLQDYFVALRARAGEEENGKPFHIAKVVRIFPDKRFEVHWYAERGIGKYYPFNEKGRDGRVTKKAVLQTFGWDCGILCYNFKLKADKSLLANTLGKINEVLSSVPLDEATAENDDRVDEDESGDGASDHEDADDEDDEEDDEEDEDAPLIDIRRRCIR
jgi:hypothetical protein